MKPQKTIHPEWATKHRTPRTELRRISGRYYLYEVSSKYDPVKKRAKKITGKILGTITEKDGFIPSSKRTLAQKAGNAVDLSSIAVREYGFTAFLAFYNSLIEERLQKFFPDHYRQIIYMAYARLLFQSPLKNISFHINKSMMTVSDDMSYSEKDFSSMLRTIGTMRQQATSYMQSFIKPNDYVMVDMTNMFSASNSMRFVKQGYNSDMIFEGQFNLMYIYSPELKQPVFYRLFAGNTKEVTGFKLCLQESGLQQAVIVADKGFYSKTNIEVIREAGLQYIIPLKRDSSLVDYSELDRKNNLFFKFEERYVWYAKYEREGQQIFLFRDEKLKVQEEKDYLDRIEKLPEEYSIELFHQKSERFGTMAMVSNLEDAEAEHIYTTYKSRNNVEVMFDGVKNILHADRTYMQNEDALQGWMFVNHIALQWYYNLYSILQQHKQLKRYSVSDFIKHLYEIKKVKINDKWVTEPITKASKDLLAKLNIHIT